MIPDVISIGGAAFRTSFIQSFASRKEWIDDRMKTTGTHGLIKLNRFVLTFSGKCMI